MDARVQRKTAGLDNQHSAHKEGQQHQLEVMDARVKARSAQISYDHVDGHAPLCDLSGSPRVTW